MASTLENEICAALDSRTLTSIAACIESRRLTVPNDVCAWRPSPTPLLVSYQLSEARSTCPDDGSQVFKLVWTPWNLFEQRPEHVVTVYKRRNLELYSSPDETNPEEDEVIVLRQFVAAQVRVFPGALDDTIFSNRAPRARMIMDAYMRSLERNCGLVSVLSRTVVNSQGKRERQILWEENRRLVRGGRPTLLTYIVHIC